MEKVENLHKFLTETFSELSERLKEFNETVNDLQSSEGSANKMLESALICWEEIAASMDGFKNDLSKRNLLKETLNVPKFLFLNAGGKRNRDSGIDTVSSSGSPNVSSNRLSSVDADNGPEERAIFNLKSTRASMNDFGESTADDKPEPCADDISTVYIHLVPTDQNTDLTALRAEIRKISRSTMKSDNIEVNVVPPDSVISIPSHHSYPYDQVPSSARTSRQISSSSEMLNAIRNRLPSSNDSLLSAMWQMSTKTPEEHTDSSDDQSSRLVSSSDSEVSLIRYRLLLITSETQTDAVDLLDRKSVETQTD